MGTQTQDQNRQQQGGNEKKAPSQHQKPAHDPIVDPDRDDEKRLEGRTDKGRQQGRRADDDDDSTEQPAKGEVIDDDDDDEDEESTQSDNR